MKRILFFIAMIGLSSLSLPALSFNYDFLHDSTVKKFDTEDWNLVNQTTEKALTLPNGEKATWKNPKTGHFGFVQPIDTLTNNGVKCRHLRIFNRANFSKDHYVFLYCKHKDGWKISR